MSVLIGHASIDENKNIKNGIAGDQTGKEVCTRLWYNGSWKYVLRCKDIAKAELIARYCEEICKNPCIGYDQNERNTLIKVLRNNGYNVKNINTPCECDCSSLVAVCTELAGIKVYSSTNAPTTTSMKAVFSSTGYFDVIEDPKYLTSDKYLKRGDILVNTGHHTVIVLGNGENAQNVPNSVQNNQKNVYITGKVYTLIENLYIRTEPYGQKMKYECITQDAKKKSHFDAYGCAILDKGSRATCIAVDNRTDSTWILIPSGWICACEKGRAYIE